MTAGPRTPFDRIFLALFVIGLCLLCFVAGQASMYFRWLPSYLFNEAVLGGEAWMAEIRKEHTAAPRSGNSQLTVKVNKEGAYRGYTLVIPNMALAMQLIDMEGRKVHEWHLPKESLFAALKVQPRTHIFFTDAEILPDGDVIAVLGTTRATPYGYALVRLDKNSNLKWAYGEPAHHWVTRDREGGSDIYTVTHRFIRLPVSGAEDMKYPLLNDSIAILSEDGKEKQRISVLNAFIGTPYEYLLKMPGKKGEYEWDPLHTNTVVKLEPSMSAKFPMFKAGHLLISLRNLHSIAVIDPATGKVIWAHRGPWKRQHSATFLANGNILLFDNLGLGKFARIVEFNPATAKIEWEYRGNKKNKFRCDYFGSVWQLPNGNISINSTLQGRITEITHDTKQPVWVLENHNKKTGKRMNITSMRRYAAEELPFLQKAKP